jgi:hypothetical protein
MMRPMGETSWLLEGDHLSSAACSEGVADIFNTQTESGFANERRRIDGTIDLSLRSGATLGLSPTDNGISSTTRTASGMTV